jgi:hypothetical protein
MSPALSGGDRGDQSTTFRGTPGRRGAVPGVVRLVGRVAAYREVAAVAYALKVIKHGGFARFWRETPCASAGSRKGLRTHVPDR